MSKTIRNTIIVMVVGLLMISAYHLSTQIIGLSVICMERMKSTYHIAYNLIILYFIIKDVLSINRIVYYKWIVSIFGVISLYFTFKIFINLAYLFKELIPIMNSINKDLYAIGLVGIILITIVFVKFRIK